MSGIGRRTQYRKHLTDSVLFDSPEPQANEIIAKVVATRGSNQFDVKLARNQNKLASSVDNASDKDNGNGSNSTQRQEHDDSSTVLAILPTKFRTLVWVKRNDFVIVQCAADAEAAASNEVDDDDGNTISTASNANTGGIRYMISHILYKDQIHHLQTKGLWPVHDPEFASKINNANENVDDAPKEDGIVYANDTVGRGEDSDEEYNSNDDDLLFVNTNRVANLALQDSSSDEDDS